MTAVTAHHRITPANLAVRRVAVVAACLTLTLSSACTGGEPDRRTSASPSPSRPALRVVEAPTAPDGGTIRVVESGFSLATDGGMSASYGAVVENTSREYAVHVVPVVFQFFDANSQPTGAVGQGTPTEIRTTAHLIAPQGRGGLAHDDGAAGVGAQLPTRFTVTLPDRYIWIRASVLPKLTVGTPSYVRAPDGTWSASVPVDSESPSIQPSALFIQRNAAGAVIGGWQSAHNDKPTPAGQFVMDFGMYIDYSVRRNGVVPEKADVYLNLLTPSVDKNGKPLYPFNKAPDVLVQ